MLNKGRDGWVPFDEMWEHMRQGITAHVTSTDERLQPVSRTALQEYITHTLTELERSYATVSSYHPHDRAMLHSINGRTRALVELATQFGIDHHVPHLFRG